MLIVVSLAATLFLAVALFFAVEYKKKFQFMDKFARESKQLIAFNYLGARKLGIHKGMHSIAICWNQPFSALVGFNLTVPLLGSGFDYYGLVSSEEVSSGLHLAVLSTYLGNGACEFLFLVNGSTLASKPAVYADYEDPILTAPTEVYPPHWYQKLGFYA
jgi:hypothetical protein